MYENEGPEQCSHSLFDHHIMYFLLSFYAPLGLLTFIKDDCPSADVAPQTNYIFFAASPHSLSGFCKRNTKSGPGYQLGLCCMERDIVLKFRVRTPALFIKYQMQETLKLSKHFESYIFYSCISSCR